MDVEHLGQMAQVTSVAVPEPLVQEIITFIMIDI